MAETHRHPRTPTTYVLRAIVVVYLVLLVIWPVALVVTNTFENGDEALRSIIEDPDMQTALRLTAFAAICATTSSSSRCALSTWTLLPMRGLMSVKVTLTGCPLVYLC